MSRFKQCPNGHTIPANLDECPLCNKNMGHAMPHMSGSQTTQIISSLDGEVGLHTTTDDSPVQAATSPNLDPHQDFSKTMVEQEVDIVDQEGRVTTRTETRASSRLVGWLVTYDLDPFGVDFRLYEGRNLIGKDPSCNVCINDPKVSGQHAILLYRNGKYRIKDNLSVNGTIINGEDIDDDSVLLADGDIIQVGNTVLLFRTSTLDSPK